MEIKRGDKIETPRFCAVKVAEVFTDLATAHREGFYEPCHTSIPGWTILGKHAGENKMIFAAART